MSEVQVVQVGQSKAKQSRQVMKAHSQESEVRMLLRNGQTSDLVAYVLFRPVGSDLALVCILGQVFTIDYVRRLVQAGVTVHGDRRSTRWPKVQMQADVNRLFGSYPKLNAADFAWDSPKTGKKQ